MIYHPAFKQLCGMCHKPRRLIHETALWKIYYCWTCDGC